MVQTVTPCHTTHTNVGVYLTRRGSFLWTRNGYIKSKLRVSIQVLVELKRVLKEDAGLELNVSKTSVLPKGVTHQATFDVEHNIISVGQF